MCQVGPVFGIPVVVKKDGDVFTVTDSEINMYGVGDTQEEARKDYESAVLEYFEILNENEHRLNGNLKAHLYYLRTKAKYFEAVS
jgi:ribosomal protein S12 methylthiotransferase accessory factor YcaO